MAMASNGTAQAAFVPALARGLAALEPSDLADGNLSLPLGLSLWMRRSGTDLVGARQMMLVVRGALLAASGLDRATEPTPLLAGDERTVVLHLAVYLEGLVARAARAAGESRRAVVEAALALLAG
ncbi:MAG TPA: hypothetical protein VKG43_12505 [Acidimicrobiales bacterium]|nr:hypothetical protein [Acidimicrobiales bacterium]